MRDLLLTLREEAFAEIEEARNSVPRVIRLPQSDQVIKVAIGMRRTGKTYTLFQRIQQLLDKGIEKERILFIDFEDDRLVPLTMSKMAALIDEFYSIFPDNYQKKCYIFLDEVQNVEEWHRVVRRIFKSKSVELTITGSSSKLLSTEINSSLRGRSLATEVFPFSFKEYRIAHNLAEPQAPFGRQAYDIAIKQLQDFFSMGGFPAVQHMQFHDWRETLQGYVDTVILKDIVERYGIKNITIIKYLAKTLITNVAAPFSVNKFFNDIKSQGAKVSRDTIHTYIDYLADAYLVFTVPYYTESVRVQQTQPSKIYAIDNGLVSALSLKVNDLYGKLLENQVYLDLRRQGKKVFYYKTEKGYEIDFVTKDKNNQYELIQVVWNMNDPKTAEREQRALTSAESELGLKGRIITSKDYAVTQLS